MCIRYVSETTKTFPWGRLACSYGLSEYAGLGAVHILRQPPEGGEGVEQMLTIADEGGWGQRKF